MKLYKEREIIHYPTLKTMLMVEDVLRKADVMIDREELKRRLPMQIMHQTLNLILIYLEEKGMIIDSHKGILWVYNPSPKLKKLLKILERFKLFENKEIKVNLSEEADLIYQELNKIVGEEKRRGIDGSFHQTLLRSIIRTKDLLKQNPFVGNQMPKKQIPKKYSSKYDVSNLWRMELADRWRLIYTITGNQLEIINFVLDIFNHREYDKVFGYKH